EPEIRVEAYDKIDQWREKLDETEKLKKRDIFERAACDLFLEAEYERDLRAVQAITDAVYVLGRDHAGLDDDGIQFVMVGARARVERPVNEHSFLNEEPPPNSPNDYSNIEKNSRSNDKTNLPVSFPLQAFDNIRLDPERRGYLVKGLIPSTGLAVNLGPTQMWQKFLGG